MWPQATDLAAQAGAVYVFRRGATVWTQEAYVKATNTAAGDDFGTAVALSDDGDTLAVGAYSEDSAAVGVGGNQASNQALDSGAVYVYRRTGSSWAPEAYVKASNTEAGDQFGGAVALSGDGVRLAVGAYAEDGAAVGVGGDGANNQAVGSGAVYVFTRGAGAWAQEAYVKASNTGGSFGPGGFSGDQFGQSVALSVDGTRLAVGAPLEQSAATGVGGDQASDGVERAGAAYVFERAVGGWGQGAYVKASNTGAADLFGYTLALSRDGLTLAVGAFGEASASGGVMANPNDDTAPGAGAAYVYR